MRGTTFKLDARALTRSTVGGVGVWLEGRGLSVRSTCRLLNDGMGVTREP